MESVFTVGKENQSHNITFTEVYCGIYYCYFIVYYFTVLNSFMEGVISHDISIAHLDYMNENTDITRLLSDLKVR